MNAPFNYAEPNWEPLERAVLAAGLPLDTCGEFMWMQEEPQGVNHYKHHVTRLYFRVGDLSIPQSIRDLRIARGAA